VSNHEFRHNDFVLISLVDLQSVSERRSGFDLRPITRVRCCASDCSPAHQIQGEYPPEKQEKTTQTVLEQAKLLCGDWAEAT